MCNAWNHAPDCACGFGPPYPEGRITAGVRREWHESIPLDGETSFLGRLLELGLEPDASEEGAKLYRSAVSESGYSPEHRGLIKLSSPAQSRIVEWLKGITGGYKYKVEKTIETTIDLPLFTLHSPKTSGSRVTYEDSQAMGDGKGWGITVFGLGFGATQEMRVTYKMKIMTTGGGCKVIFVPRIPVRIKVQKLYKRGSLVGEQLNAEVYGITEGTTFCKGVRTCPAQECTEDVSPDDKSELFPLSTGIPGDVATYARQWTRGEGCEINLAVNVGILKLTMKASVRPEQAVTLTYELPEGHDYRLRYLARKHGISWAVE